MIPSASPPLAIVRARLPSNPPETLFLPIEVVPDAGVSRSASATVSESDAIAG